MNWHMYGNMFGNGFGAIGAGGSLLLVLLIWSLFWKGLALWHSARRGEYWWFGAFLIVNTAGILEIVYLFAFAKRRLDTLFSMDSETELRVEKTDK